MIPHLLELTLLCNLLPLSMGWTSAFFLKRECGEVKGCHFYDQVIRDCNFCLALRLSLLPFWFACSHEANCHVVEAHMARSGEHSLANSWLETEALSQFKRNQTLPARKRTWSSFCGFHCMNIRCCVYPFIY